VTGRVMDGVVCVCSDAVAIGSDGELDSAVGVNSAEGTPGCGSTDVITGHGCNRES